MLTFPKNFSWGTATSAHQIEGDNTKNDWWDAENKTLLRHKSGKACDSYTRYEEDFDFAKAMGNNAHRFSIEWSRVEPEEGKFDEQEIEHYRKVLQALRARGLEPFVTLHHFTNPVWFAQKGGWTNKKAPEYFAKYAEYVGGRLGNEVAYWITINEPVILASAGYMGTMGFTSGGWPPFRKNDVFGFLSSVRNMAKAHKRAYSLIHSRSEKAQVGIAQNCTYFEAYRGQLLSRIMAALARHVWNEWFLGKISNEQDFVGINYYSRNCIHVRFSHPRRWFNQNENKEVSDFGWEIYPEGIYHVARAAYKKYKKQIYITENGISDADDDQRQDFIKKHLAWLHKAIGEGADVRGYFYWSLLDNFEWAEGFTQRFGLVEVNFETLERTMRPSGKVYGGVAGNNGLT